MTALDFVGVYDPLVRLKTMGFIPDLRWDVCALSRQVKDSTGLAFVPTRVALPLDSYDIVIVPGGFGSRQLVDDAEFIEWLKTAKPCRLKASVCTGALLLGAAGFLQGKRATTHPNALEQLREFCAEVKHARIVDEGEVVTAGGVTSGIDLGLYLCGKLAGQEVRQQIQRQIDYPEK
jgi:transcriptional regulator GlxA family with amidase domain